MGEFVHLHLHSQYSFLDGAIKIKELIPRIKALEMDSVAVTDHGNMHGVLEFYKAAKKGGIKPIIGCEAYISKKGRLTKETKDSYHLILLAKNSEGFRNLMHLVSIGYLEGFYYKPRIDKEVLREYSKGLIGLTACLGGELAKEILEGSRSEAIRLALEYKDIFEEDSFYLEIQENGLPEQKIVNDALIEISKITKIPLVATNDSHYILKEHAKAHDILMKIQMKQTISAPKRHETDAYYIRSPKEIKELFHYAPEAIENTVKIAQMCNVDIETGVYYLPDFPVPDGYDVKSYFEHVAWEGLKERFNDIEDLDIETKKIYEERLQFEIDVINQMGFQGYFLIVWDFIKYAKDNSVPVGPGRGSGAGSIVAYSMRITDLDPIPLDLLFERFLNPDRVSMPDFDIDFCQDKRGVVIDYVKRKYGEFRVAQIANFSQLKAKSVIRDVGRVLEIPLKEVYQLAKMIPDDLDIDLNKALERNPKINEAIANNSDYKQIIEIGMALEGLYRQAGVHAAGIVIGNKDLWNYTPVFIGNDGFLVTQFEKNNVEEVGLVKFDFLGLKTLTVIDKALSYVNKNVPKEKQLDISKISLKDRDVYKIYSQGSTDGIFQFESAGMKKYLKELKPDRFEDIIAMNALYRPGPMEYIPNYIARKHGKEAITYDHSSMEEYLKETYGITVYQEQVMLLSRKMAGFTRGEADTLRKAMGKKNIDLLNKLFPKFVKGCSENHGISEDVSKKIWQDWEAFAKYAFNKSHSACYAYVSFQTAYLKYYHPAEFMAAMLSLEASDNTKVVKHIISAKEEGLMVIPPDINKSYQDFTVENKEIIFGLGGIKGVGDAALENIIEERDANGDFTSFYEFMKRVDGRKVNKKVVESLIKAGVFDSLYPNRAAIFNSVDNAILSAQNEQKYKKSGLKSLFGASNESEEITFEIKNSTPWAEEIRLKFEKEIIGFYISGHPIYRYFNEFEKYGFQTIESHLEDGRTGNSTQILAMIDNFKIITTQSKKQMASFTIEDHTNSISVTCFPAQFEKYYHIFSGNLEQPFIFKGEIKEDRKGNFNSSEDDDSEVVYQFALQDIIELEVFREDIKHINLELSIQSIDDNFLKFFEELFLKTVNGKTSYSFKIFIERYNSFIKLSPKSPITFRYTEDIFEKFKLISEKKDIKLNFLL